MIKTFWFLKYKKNKKKTGSCWALTWNPGVPGPPKCHQMQPSSQWRHMYNKGKQFENQFFIYTSQNVKNDQWSDWAYLAFQLSSHPYPCTCQIRKQSDKKFLSLNPKYGKNIYFFSYLGVLGGPYIEPRWTKISGQQALITEQTYL